LFEQAIRLAASRAACTAGSNKPTSTPMIAITTNNSTKVKALRLKVVVNINVLGKIAKAPANVPIHTG
jgi:hypothetical protein